MSVKPVCRCFIKIVLWSFWTLITVVWHITCYLCTCMVWFYLCSPVFHRPNISHDLLPPLKMHSVSRVAVAKLLGVHLRHDLNFSQQVESVVVTCNQRLYLLAQLKKQGLGISALDSVFKAVVLNKILYSLPVYFGYLTEGQRHMLQRVLHIASSRGLPPITMISIH